MSLLKQILSPFVEFESDKKQASAEAAKSATTSSYNAAPPPVDTPAQHPLITGTPDTAQAQQTTTAPAGGPAVALPEHKQYFESLIDQANATNPLFEGSDFKEFRDSKLDIDNIADEETRYKTAFNILKRTGLTKERLLSTAHEYHNIVGRDLNAFQGAHSQQYQKEVRQREQMVQKKAEELSALTAKVNALKKEISDLSQEMVETKNKLNLTKNSFLLAGEYMQLEIQNEIEKIEKYF